MAGRGVEEGDEIGGHAQVLENLSRGGKPFRYNQTITGKRSGERKLFVNEAWLPRVRMPIFQNVFG